MPTLTTEETVREILEMCYLTFGVRDEDEALVANVMRVLAGHDREALNGRSSEAFQGVSEYIAESWDDNLAFGEEVAVYIFHSLNRYDELSEDDKRIYSKPLIENFIAMREEYRIK